MKKSPESTIFDFLRKSHRSELLCRFSQRKSKNLSTKVESKSFLIDDGKRIPNSLDFPQIGKNKQKITDVSHFEEQPALYKNFWGMKPVWDRKNTSRGKEYKKMKKIVGGARAALKSA